VQLGQQLEDVEGALQRHWAAVKAQEPGHIRGLGAVTAVGRVVPQLRVLPHDGRHRWMRRLNRPLRLPQSSHIRRRCLAWFVGRDGGGDSSLRRPNQFIHGR